MKNYDQIHIIEVTHQYGCRSYAVDDLITAAENFRGHEYIKVRRLAREILDENAEA